MDISSSICDKLHKFNSIGIDFDGTLFDGKHSKALVNFVKTFHKEKDLYVVTFRTHQLVGLIDDDLHCIGLNRSYFKGVIAIPALIMQNYNLCTSRNSDLLFSRKEKEEAIDEFLHWKGYVCHLNGIEVLIDDMKHLVVRGTTKYGVEFINCI